MSNLQELIAQKAAIDAQIAAAKESAFADVLTTVVVLCEENGFGLDEMAAGLLTEHKKRSRKKSKAPKSNRPAKFRYIPTGAEWNGYGRKPSWMSDEGNVRKL